MLEDLTLIIPTYCRQIFLPRLVDFYKLFSIRLIIVDGTNGLPAFDPPVGIDNELVSYFHMPESSLGERILFASNMLITPYVAWLVRCSILSALAEQPGINPAWLLDLGKQAIADADGTVRVSGAEILARVVREQVGDTHGSEARALLQPLQQDADHRVVAAALNGLQP